MPKSVIDILNKKYNLRLKQNKTSAKTVKEEAIAKSIESVIDSLQQVVEWLRETSV
jgi:hypothetical protein